VLKKEVHTADGRLHRQVVHAQAAKGGMELPVSGSDVTIDPKVRKDLENKFGESCAKLGEGRRDGAQAVAKAGPQLQFVAYPCPFWRQVTIVEPAVLSSLQGSRETDRPIY
jgi:hypothetical protein